MRSADEVIEDALYAELRHLLSLCTEDQNAFLWRIYLCARPRPKFPLKEDDLRTILALVQRTVKKNTAEAHARKGGK